MADRNSEIEDIFDDKPMRNASLLEFQTILHYD